MKFVTFDTKDNRGNSAESRGETGILVGSDILPLVDLAPELGVSMRALIAAWDVVAPELRAFVRAAPRRVPLSAVHLLAPVPRPGKILAMGLNYRDHIREAHLGEPKEQIWFCKQPTSANGPFDDIPIPAATHQLDYEAEMVAVIGKGGRNISRADAPAAVFGFCCGNDVSMRDWQKKSSQWTLGKGGDGHAPFGPAITTTDEVGDPQSLGIRCFVNGEMRQNSNTKHMVYTVWDQIACLSQVMTLEPGDIIFTGTPGGVAMGMEQPLWLQDGDVVRVEIDKLGALEGRCQQGWSRF